MPMMRTPASVLINNAVLCVLSERQDRVHVWPLPYAPSPLRALVDDLKTGWLALAPTGLPGGFIPLGSLDNLSVVPLSPEWTIFATGETA